MIAVVDDDDGVREAISGLLRALGHRVFAFATAEDFLKSKHLSATSCLITDVQMPGINGIELQERLKASGHGFPVIVITGFPDDRLLDRAIQLGARAVLVKPLGAGALEEHVARALSR